MSIEFLKVLRFSFPNVKNFELDLGKSSMSREFGFIYANVRRPFKQYMTQSLAQTV